MSLPTPATPPASLPPATDLQTFPALVRKHAAAGTVPTVDVVLWEAGGGTAVATLASGVTMNSESGTVIRGT